MRRRYIYLIIVLILLFFFDYLFSYSSVDMFVKVDDYVGFNVDTDALYFGIVSPGGGGYRFLNLSSVDTKKVFIISSGKMRDWVFYETGFVFEGNRSVRVDLKVPLDVEYGNYSGKLRLMFIRII